MRPLLTTVVLCLLASCSALAADPGNRAGPKDVPPGTPPPAVTPRSGDTLADAIVITGLPFTASGNTCGFQNDYDEICPYTGSLSPDVVYSYTPYSYEYLTISLCSSGYDTKVYVWQNEIFNVVACNDDACGWDGYRSELYGVYVAPGNTYYIIIDGYGGACGDYELEIFAPIYEILQCPAGAVLEGEPDCTDGYEDTYNGGCNSVPPVFTDLYGTPGGERFDVCGTAGTYEFGSQNYRDTDWYRLQVTEESTITFYCSAMFPLRNFLIDASAGCATPEILATETASLFPDYTEITWTLPPGEYWYWVGTDVYTGVDCGTLYVFSVEGYAASPIPVTRTSWGEAKARHR